MSTKTEFMEFVSSNDEVRKEMAALQPDFAQKPDLEQEYTKAYFDTLVKFAAKHGFNLTAEDFQSLKSQSQEMEELSEDELTAVAGGKNEGGGCGNLIYNDAINYVYCGMCHVIYW